MSTVEPDFAVLIAGGGPVGSALALALAAGGQSVVVIEPHAQTASSADDSRATVLAEGTVRMLDALGVWPRLAATAVPVREVEVSVQGQFGRTRLRAEDLAVDALGQIVSHQALANSLATAASEAGTVTWLSPARVTRVENTANQVVATIESDGTQRTVAAQLVVAADGSESAVREMLGIAAERFDYGQTALLLELTLEDDPGRAYERFASEGTLALLPAGGQRRTLVWTVPQAQAHALVRADSATRMSTLRRQLGRQLEPLSERTSPRAWPLHRIAAQRAWAGRAVLAGNAARTLHPIGAQGFNLAMRDVGALAESLAGAVDAGHAEALSIWDRKRTRDRALTRGFTDLLARGFGHGGLLPGGLRAGMLLGLDLCPLARQQLLVRAMGLAERLPRIGTWRVQR